MPNHRFLKYSVVFFILLLSVFLDQWTKYWAEEHLASFRYSDHELVLTVPSEVGEETLSTFIAQKYPRNNEADRARMIAFTSRDGEKLSGMDKVKGGDTLHLKHASITVIPGYYDYQYARNPGSAWSLFADQPETFRKTFFGITGVLALLLLGYFIFRSSWSRQRMLVITLACILGGAIGNIIDRFRLGYVIDFISWHIGDKYWPTFNIADVFVTCGVAFLIIDMLIHRDGFFGASPEKKSENGDKKIESKDETPSDAEVKDESKGESKDESKDESKSDAG